jgi:acyl-coenzyme A thioesterase PaaI-like protein
MNTQISLQKQYAAKSICFGCGPANADGLQIESYVDGDGIICSYLPKPYHHAFPGVLNGGVIGTLLDCHCNWSACYYLMLDQKQDEPPCTVTAEFTIKLRRPTPVDKELFIVAKSVGIEGNKARIHGDLFCEEKLCATCDALFVSVDQNHPAYHRW